MLDYRFYDEKAAALMVRVMAGAGYDLVALGDQELAGGESFFYEGVLKAGLPIVALNLTGRDGPCALPVKVFDVGGFKVGATAVLEPSLLRYYPNVTTVEAVPYEKPLRRAVKDFRKAKVDLCLVIAHAPLDRAKTLAETTRGIDVIITGHDQSDFATEPLRVGNTYIVSAGCQGMAAGYIIVTKTGKGSAFEFGKITMDEAVAKDPVLDGPIESYYDDLYASLAANRATWLEKRIIEDGTLVESNDKCGACHATQWDQWKATKHAAAYETIEKKVRTESPECLYCHTTYYGVATAYGLPVKPNPGFADVGCISCHTVYRGHPGSGGAEPVSELACIVCHNSDRSPGFKFSDAVKGVTH